MIKLGQGIFAVGYWIGYVAVAILVVAVLAAVLGLLIASGPIGWFVLFMILCAGDRSTYPSAPISDEINVPDVFPEDWANTNSKH